MHFTSLKGLRLNSTPLMPVLHERHAEGVMDAFLLNSHVSHATRPEKARRVAPARTKIHTHVLVQLFTWHNDQDVTAQITQLVKNKIPREPLPHMAPLIPPPFCRHLPRPWIHFRVASQWSHGLSGLDPDSGARTHAWNSYNVLVCFRVGAERKQRRRQKNRNLLRQTENCETVYQHVTPCTWRAQLT